MAPHVADSDRVGPIMHSVRATTRFYLPIRARADAILAEAAELVHTPKQAQRLRVIRTNWEWVKITMDTAEAVERLEAEIKSSGNNPSKPVITAAKRAIEKWRQFIDDTRAWDTQHLVMEKDVRGGGGAPQCDQAFDSAAAQIRQILAGERKVADARRIASPQPTQADWDAAKPFGEFTKTQDADPKVVPTQFRVLYNTDAVFLRIECSEPDGPVAMHSKITDRDGQVWTDNNVDFFLDPDNARKEYFHFIVNTLGTQFDTKQTEKEVIPWNGQWEAAVTKTDKAWTVDVAIPFATLGVKSLLPGDVWGLNVCRVRPATREYAAWSPTFGLFNNPYQFGQLVFR